MSLLPNPMAPPGSTADDAVLARVEQMISPSFDLDDLPRLADESAELPWMSGGTMAIEPDFDTTGLPTVAATADDHGWSLHGRVDAPDPAPEAAPLSSPGPFAPPVQPVALTAPAAAPAVALTAPPAAAPLTGAPSPTGTPHTFAPPSALPAPQPLGQPDSAASATPSAPTGDLAPPSRAVSWDAPAADAVADEQLAAPIRLIPAPQRRTFWNPVDHTEGAPRTSLLVALAFALVAALAMAVVVLLGDDAPSVSVASEPTVGASSPSSSIPLVLPAFTPVDHPWTSMSAHYESVADQGVMALDLSGPASHEIVRAVTSSHPVGATTALDSTELLVTSTHVYTEGLDRYERTPEADLGVFGPYTRMLNPRLFDTVVPSMMRPLVTVESVTDVAPADPAAAVTTPGLRRYVLDVRMDAFATQYPDAFATWSELNAWGQEMPDSVDLTVDVDETGLVTSTAVSTLDGTVTVSSSLSSAPSDVTLPEDWRPR